MTWQLLNLTNDSPLLTGVAGE